MPALPDQLPSPRSATPARAKRKSPGNHALIAAAGADHPLLQSAGGLGLAGVLLGLVLLMLACAGYNAAFDFSPAVLALGFAAAILSLIASKNPHQTTRILASLFIAMFALLTGILELAMWLHG